MSKSVMSGSIWISSFKEKENIFFNEAIFIKLKFTHFVI